MKKITLLVLLIVAVALSACSTTAGITNSDLTADEKRVICEDVVKKYNKLEKEAREAQVEQLTDSNNYKTKKEQDGLCITCLYDGAKAGYHGLSADSKSKEQKRLKEAFSFCFL